MKYLVDTCVISEMLRPRPNAGVVAWMDSCDEAALFISVLSFGEIEKGVAKLSPGKRRNALRHWVEHDLAEKFSGRIVPIDLEVAVTWGRMQAAMELAGTPLPMVDGLLCATALAHNLTVLTRNTRDFEPSGIHTLNPWQ